MPETAPERTPLDDTTDAQQRLMNPLARVADDVGLRLLKVANDFGEGDQIAGNLYVLRDAVMAVVSPVLEAYRKAVEDAPGVAIWTGACVECGTTIQPGDAITWRLRWSPQGPIHEECR